MSYSLTLKRFRARLANCSWSQNAFSCLFKQLDAVLPSTFQPGRIRIPSLLKVPGQNVRAGLQHIANQLSHQLVLCGLFQPHQELQQNDVASPVGMWVSTVSDQHAKPHRRLEINRAGRLLTCQLCQSWHHENWCRVYGSSRGQEGNCEQVPGRWICQHALSPDPLKGWNKKYNSQVKSFYPRLRKNIKWLTLLSIVASTIPFHLYRDAKLANTAGVKKRTFCVLLIDLLSTTWAGIKVKLLL